MIKIEDFLIEAKKQTYANETIEKAKSTRQNSKDYEYKKDNMVYHDTYFGGTNFIGEEVVYIDNKTYRCKKNKNRKTSYKKSLKLIFPNIL